MHLKRNWWDVLVYAWSVRFIALSFLLNAAASAIAFLDGVLPIEQWKFALLVATVNMGALVSRVVAQKDLPDDC